MTNERPASWRMPSPKQMEKLALEAARQPDCARRSMATRVSG
jgi:hypothetical protein